ncbi:hypothetical protein CRYUN_Cryun16bG0031400 [Craigia yunnanensis]
MRGIRFTRSKLYAFSVFANIHLKTRHLKPTQYQKPIFETVGTTTRTIAITKPVNICFPFQSSSFSTSNFDFPSEPKVENFDENINNDDGEDSECFDGNSVNGLSLSNEGTIQDVKGIMDIIHETHCNYVEMKNKLELCDIKDAEHLMLCNKDVFPFNTKSFNIILNGWCNVIGSPREAERVRKEMSKRGVRHDVVSYAKVMSCYSKACNINKVLKLFTQMKLRGIEPDRKVFNAVIHALAKARHVKEAINLLKTMEEKGIAPNVVTYNSLIKPLCKARKIDEARQVFDEMLQKDLSPTIQTYHAFLRILRNGEEAFQLLETMKKMHCQPTNDTYIILIRKFSRWCQYDNIFKMWNEMTEKGVCPDRSSYIVLIHGLFLNGKLDEAYKFYMEMKEKQLLPEPKIDEMLKDWVSGKKFAE